MVEIRYVVSPKVDNESLNRLFFAAWTNHADIDFLSRLQHSLAWVCAYSRQDELVGFVNVAWDSGIHAFLLDTTVHPAFQRLGIGTELVKNALSFAKTQNIMWMHVDYELHLDTFYKDCGFSPTLAGLVNLETL